MACVRYRLFRRRTLALQHQSRTWLGFASMSNPKPLNKVLARVACQPHPFWLACFSHRGRGGEEIARLEPREKRDIFCTILLLQRRLLVSLCCETFYIKRNKQIIFPFGYLALDKSHAKADTEIFIDTSLHVPRAMDKHFS